MSKQKTHWTCISFNRGTAKPGCHRTIEAGSDERKKIADAGWRRVDTQNMRIFYKCPACTPQCKTCGKNVHKGRCPKK